MVILVKIITLSLKMDTSSLSKESPMVEINKKIIIIVKKFQSSSNMD